jgi:hypothetical protein
MTKQGLSLVNRAIPIVAESVSPADSKIFVWKKCRSSGWCSYFNRSPARMSLAAG